MNLKLDPTTDDIDGALISDGIQTNPYRQNGRGYPVCHRGCPRLRSPVHAGKRVAVGSQWYGAHRCERLYGAASELLR